MELKNWSWSHRIMKRMNSYGDFEYGIYEVYYDGNGTVQGWTKDSVCSVKYSEEELKFELEAMMKAFEHETILYKEE